MSGRCVNMMINDVDDIFQFSRGSKSGERSMCS